MREIIIMPMYGIGDMIMATPALRNLKQRTGAHITCLHMFKTTREILLGNPHIDEHHHFPFLTSTRLSGLRFLYQFRKRKAEASINFYPSNRRDYNLASFVVGCPVRIGHRYREHDIRGMSFLNNRTLMEDDTLHNVEEDLRLLSFLGIAAPTPYAMEIYLSEEERTAAAHWLRERRIEVDKESVPLIGMHAGSSTFKDHTHKRWPEERFALLIDELVRIHPEASVLLFGGREELAMKEHLRGLTHVQGRVHTVETEGIRATAALLERCSLMVTNDSCLMHMSAALQVPTAALFGPTNPLWLHPWKCRHKVLRSAVCQPCFRYSPTPVQCTQAERYECLRGVGVDEVLAASLALLRGVGAP